MLFASRWLFILLSLLSTSAASPVNESLKVDFAVKSDKSWLWGWAWGSESTVSVVDRSPVVTFYSRPAAFGAEINDPILGYIIPISSFTKPCVTNETITNEPDNSGCPSLCLSGEKEPADAWIALVQRGGCEFVKKVREAQRFGAKAVVVGGENPEKTGYSDSLVNMYSPEDSSDVKIAATYIRYIDYMQLYALIATSNTSHSGLRTLSLLITAEYSVWEWYSPIITFVVILLLPSILTFVTLLIHRIRAARAAQRDRAPENVVHGLPWRVWTGNGWEKHEGNEDAHTAPDQPSTAEVDLEEGILPDVPLGHDGANNTSGENPSTSHPNKTTSDQPWFETQQECAICLSDFVRGDKVRVLPCHHIFHLHEVDEWLIHRKKLCPVCKADVTVPLRQPQPQQPQNPQANQRDDETQHLTLQTRPANPTETTPLLGN